MEVRFESYLARGGEAVPVAEWTGGVPDVHYVTGSIELVVGSTVMMRRAEFDLVDQLWMYLLAMTEDAIAGQRAKMYYPDQPTEMVFDRLDSGMLDFRITAGSFDRRVVVPLADWCVAIVRDGRAFWWRLGAIAPEMLDVVGEALDMIDGIEAATPPMA